MKRLSNLKIILGPYCCKEKLLELCKLIDVAGFDNIAVVGINAKYIHDCIDDNLAQKNMLPDQKRRITTTWHESESDYNEYFQSLAVSMNGMEEKILEC